MKINITTAVYKKLTKDLVNSQIKSKNLVNRSDTADFINGAELNKDSKKAELRPTQANLVTKTDFNTKLISLNKKELK